MTLHKDLPEWLRDYIYNDLGAIYSPDKKEFQNNLYSNEEKNKRYLGTYFPRSFAESYCIFSNLFNNADYREFMRAKDTVNILSFGCGTGGDLMGLLEAIAEIMPWIKHIEVTAYDGNYNAIAMMKSIVEHPINMGRFESVRVDYAPVEMSVPMDFPLYCKLIKGAFDFIVSFKMVNELYRNKIITDRPYAALLEALMPKLSDAGVALLLDVPLPERGDWMPTLLSSGLREYLRGNDDYEAIVPLPCHVTGRECTERCFLCQVFWGEIFTSEKVTYCMLAKKDVARAVCSGWEEGRYKINDTEYCKMMSEGADKDAYNLKLR